MKNIIKILIYIFTFQVNAEIIELKCFYKDTGGLGDKVLNYEQNFTIDTQSKRMYEGLIEYVLEIQPHYFVAYPRYLFSNEELLLTEKLIFPRELWHYRINRENLNWWYRGAKSLTRLSNESKCKVIKRTNLI